MRKYVATKLQPSWRHRSSWKARVYEYIKSKGEAGAHRREIADAIGLNVGRVSSCLAELKREGLVQRLGDAIDPSTLGAEDAALYAMNALEGALVAKATESGISDEMEKQFAFYQKVKARALHTATGGQLGSAESEVRQALRLSLITLVKLIY